ncbi:MAG: phosphoserine phosphatase SerB [Acidobacteria bacterium]|nr:phosphoserine phosphatase SerB [Acidobacteriota bacterium]
MTAHPNQAKFLVVLDVDSTLIEQEVIEVLAEFAGKGAEVAEVTERAMRGELDFAGSLRARVATLAGLSESILDRAKDQIRLTKGAKELIEAVHASGGKVAAVSGGFEQILAPLAKTIGLDFYRANLLEIRDAKLTGDVIPPIIDKPAKATALLEWATEIGLKPEQTIAIGDGANDLDMMQVAGLSIGFCAKPRVRAVADVLIDSGDLAEVINILGL